jgi:hypothetical protein
MVNHDQHNTYQATIELKAKGKVQLLDIVTAESKELSYTHRDDNTILNLTFLPMQSYVVMIDKCCNAEYPAEVAETNKINLDKQWNIDYMDLNSLTLDYCRYRIDEGEWSEQTSVIKLMDILLNIKKRCDITLKFDFDVNMNLRDNNELYLVVERAHEFNISVNGTELTYNDLGWWKDFTFKKVDIKPFVKNGKNEIILKRCFYQNQKVYDVLFGENVLETERNKLTYDVELENIYVVGDFGVISKSEYSYADKKAIFTNGPFEIIDKPDKVSSGDLTQQGFCFFSGTVKLSQTLNLSRHKATDPVILQFKPNAVISKILINDQLVKIFPWAPYEADISKYLKEEDNKIVVQLFSGNRNLLGPHHHVEGELYCVGPSSFKDEAREANYYNGSTWSDRYCFVQFGLAD